MSKKAKAATIDPLEQEVLLKLSGLRKTFEQGGQTLTIFQGLDMKVEAGELVALVGQSGSGKSTLLQIAGLLDKPSEGSIIIDHQDVTKLGDAGRTKLRLKDIGFIYQFHHLLAEFTAQENVAMPLIIAGAPRDEAMDKGALVLHKLGGFPAGNNSVWRLRGRWPMIRNCYWRMSRRVISIPILRRKCLISCWNKCAKEN